MAKKTSARRWVQRAMVAVVALGLIGLVVVAWIPKPSPVDVGRVTLGPMSVTVDEDGRTRVKDRYLVSAPLLGNVARIELHPGDEVLAGQVVAHIVPLSPPLLDQRSRAEAEARVAATAAAKRQAESAISRAQTSLDFAGKELERQRSLKGKGAVAPQALERAELDAKSRADELTSAGFGAKVAAYELEMAKVVLGRLSGKRPPGEEQFEVSSPVSGRVLRVMKESEGVVQPGTALLEVGDPAALEIVADVLTADAVLIPQGARVVIEQWGGDHELRGHVRVVEPSAFTRVSALGVEEQRVNVVVDLDDPMERWKQLGDGYRVVARIVVFEAEQLLQMPASAIFRSGNRWSAYRIEGDRVRLAGVEIGRRSDRAIEIKTGLTENDQVVVYPSEALRDGAKIALR